MATPYPFPKILLLGLSFTWVLLFKDYEKKTDSTQVCECLITQVQKEICSISAGYYGNIPKMILTNEYGRWIVTFDIRNEKDRNASQNKRKIKWLFAEYVYLYTYICVWNKKHQVIWLFAGYVYIYAIWGNMYMYICVYAFWGAY